MAEALMFMGNNTHPDSIIDRRGCWKRGMIVVVLPDGAQWGGDHPSLNAAPRKFGLVRFPGVAVERMQKYLIEQTDDAGGALLQPVRFRRRLWQVQIAEAPAAVRDALSVTGIITVSQSGDLSWEQFRSLLLRHDSLARETESL